MRVISIGLDSQVGAPDRKSHAVAWVREMARHVGGYVEIGPSPDGRDAGPIPLAENAAAWLVGASPVRYPFRAASLAARLHAERPFDVITTEDPIRAGLAGVLLARRTGLPLNVENHSFHVNEPLWLKEKPHHRVYNRLAIAVCRRADSIRNYSQGQERALAGIGVEASRMFTVPIAAPEIDAVDESDARKRIALGSDPFVLFAGRMRAVKNVPLLLKAFRQLRNSTRAKLVLVGDGPSKPAWLSLALRLGVDDHVVWRDSVPFGAMADYYSAASAYVAASFTETGPRTVLEALLCSCPVVVTPEMGVVRSGICVDGESAWVVAPDDVGGWVRALESLLADPARGRAMAEAGKRRIGPQFSFSAIARQMVDVFEATVRNRRSERGMHP